MQRYYMSWGCAENPKKSSHVLLNILEKCGISGASAGCAQLNLCKGSTCPGDVQKTQKKGLSCPYGCPGRMRNFRSICSMCTTKVVAKYPKYNMLGTCENVVHVLAMCGKSEKSHPGVLIDALEKCGISRASAGCAQINWWLNAQNKI